MEKQDTTVISLDIQLADPADLDHLIRIEYGQRRKILSVIMCRDKEEKRAMLTIKRGLPGKVKPQMINLAILRSVEEGEARLFVADIKKRLENNGRTIVENYMHTIETGKTIKFIATEPKEEDSGGIPTMYMSAAESITPVL